MKSLVSKTSLLVALLSVALAGKLAANPVLITTLDLANFPSYGDGNVQSGINSAIAAWNVTHNPDLPTAGVGANPDFKGTVGANVISLNLTLGAYNYVFFHWGGPDADATYKNPQLYYIGGDSGVVNFTAPWNTAPDPDKQYGLSFYSFYSPTTQRVPDQNYTFMLIALGFACIMLTTRVLKPAKIG